ncbi:S8 family serine peptidase [Nonomuraea sp. NPDC050404]|uniref:S8 family serine peptidase n=1 Tax=Nonomuraea sp. NPDC050404 TaxID=3155783 RepID=UPI0033F097C3
MATPPRSEESEYSYVDKSNGQLTSFAAKPDEAMVTFARQGEVDTLNRIVSAPSLVSVSQGYNLERGFAAVYVSPTAMDDVSAQDDVTNSLPVMIDEHGASRYFLPNEFTVQFRQDVAEARAEEIVRQHGSRVLVKQRTPGYYTLAVPDGRRLFEMIREMSGLEEVRFAEPSEVGFNSKLLFIPGDADFGRLWGMRNTGQVVNGTTGVAGADIHATEAWELTRGDPEVIITVIDTGAALTHPDLQANILPRGAEDWDFADAGDPSPEDEDGHGSHVSGTCAAVNDTIGVLGVAPLCRVMPLRVDLTTGMNQNRADAINYVAAQAQANAERRYVINCSWRMNGDHAGVRTAIQTAVGANVVVVFAAGNANTNTDVTPQFPGVYPEVIAVAALDQADRKATFSNFGTNVDVSAPGVNIWSTFPNGGYSFLDGTSMAAPHVAGVAALVWSRNRNLTGEQVRRIVESSCDNIDAANAGFIGMLGGGRLNAMGAVTSPMIFPAHVEYTVDLTGDRKADVVGFGNAGVYVSRNLGNGNFDGPNLAIANFGYDAGGWRVERHPRFLADLIGDRRADVVGFGDGGVWVSRNNGNGTFQAPQLVVNNFGYDAGGWRVERHPRFLADLTGDRRADIIGFGYAGAWVALNKGNGTFQGLKLAVNNFGYDAGGWRVERHPRFLADVTGDGRADIVGFGDGGVWVSRNNGNGTFQAPQLVVNNFGYDAGGWRVERHPRFLADLTGDKRADIVGFGDGGVWVSLNNGNGTFQAPQLVVGNFGYEAGGWRVERHPRFLADLTGDGRADIIGFGYAGAWVALNNGNGTFQAPQLVVGNFGYDAGGWRVERHPRFVADLNGDEQADILGFGYAGAWVSINTGKGAAFANPDLKIANFGYDAGGWRVHQHPRLVVGPR